MSGSGQTERKPWTTTLCIQKDDIHGTMFTISNERHRVITATITEQTHSDVIKCDLWKQNVEKLEKKKALLCIIWNMFCHYLVVVIKSECSDLFFIWLL